MSIGQLTFIALGLIVGGLFTAIGADMLWKSVQLVRRGVRTDATVIAHEKEKSEMEDIGSKTTRSVTFYHPVLEFTDQTGRAQRVVLDQASDRIEYAEGYPVRILYLPEDPSNVSIESFGGLWGGGRHAAGARPDPARHGCSDLDRQHPGQVELTRGRVALA
jgi:hypothetical protein